MGRAGLARFSGLGMAALIIGANLPDIDVLAIPLGENLPFRRGWTHGVLAMIVLPPLLAAALLAWNRWQRRRGARPPDGPPVRPVALLLLCYAGALTHPLLDWLNPYGIRLLMPFSDRWFYGDSVFIIDPWLWLILGLGVVLSRRPAPQQATRACFAALALAGLYMLLMVYGTVQAREAARRHIAAEERSVPERLMAGPVPLDPLRRELIFDMDDHYWLGSLVWRPQPAVGLAPLTLPKNLDHPAVLAVRDHPEVRDFLVWSRFPYFLVEEEDEATVVRLRDARSFRLAEDWFTVTVRIPRHEDEQR